MTQYPEESILADINSHLRRLQIQFQLLQKIFALIEIFTGYVGAVCSEELAGWPSGTS